MLHLIGIGYKKEHINFEMMDAIKKSEKVFLEYYTSFYETSFEELENFIEKKIIISDRELIESRIEEEIMEPAKTKDIALLVIGDPLTATTHTDLLLRAKEMNIETKVYNNVGVGTFITRTGLQFYKFGRITSIPFFSEKFMPRTPYLIFQDNQKIGAHTLFLLDLNPSNDIAYKGHERYLKAHKALEFLIDIPEIMIDNEEMEESHKCHFDKDSHAVICSRLGFSDEKILYGTVEELITYDKENILREPLCLIIPGDMHSMEEEYLKQYQI